MRLDWFINPATVTPFAAAGPAAVFLAVPEGPAWVLPMFGISFIIALGCVIVWLPIAAPILVRIPGRRFTPIVFGVGCIVTGVVFGGVGLLLLAYYPRALEDGPLWLGAYRIGLSGAYFGLIATLCLYIDPNFRPSAAV